MTAVGQTELAGLLHIIEDQRKEIEALRRRKEFLERRLEQRYESTVQNYSSRIKHFESMQERVLQLFLEDIPANVGLTHEDIKREFSRKFPRIPTSNLDRRVQELAKAGKLWRLKDDGTVRFYLHLVDAPQSEKPKEKTSEQSPLLDNVRKEPLQ